MKKRLFAMLLALTMVFSLAACGGDTEETTTPPEDSGGDSATEEVSSDLPEGFKPMEETTLSMGVGSTGGGWYIMGAGLNEGFQSILPYNGTVIPGGGTTNPIIVNQGTDMQLGFTYIADAMAAHDGTFAFEGQACSNLRGLCNLGVVQYLHILATPNSGFTSIQDMIDNASDLKIAVGPRGGGNEIMLNRILEYYGTSLDGLADAGASVQYISTSEGMTAIQDGQINVINYCAAAPLASLVETLASMELVFIPVEEDAATATCEKYGYTYEACPANTYDYQEEEYWSIADTVVIVINSSVPDDTVYNLAKVIAENKDRWVTLHASFEAFDPEKAPDTGIELHPGAEAYYKDAGLLS